MKKITLLLCLFACLFPCVNTLSQSRQKKGTKFTTNQVYTTKTNPTTVLNSQELTSVNEDFVITLNAGSGSVTPTSLNCTSGNSVSLPEATPISGWNFDGWSTSSTPFTTTQPEYVSTDYSPIANITLYAVYSRVTNTTNNFEWLSTDYLESGAEYLLVYEGGANPLAMSNVVSSGQASTVQVTVIDNLYVNNFTDNSCIWTITGDITNGFSIHQGSNYIAIINETLTYSTTIDSFSLDDRLNVEDEVSGIDIYSKTETGAKKKLVPFNTIFNAYSDNGINGEDTYLYKRILEKDYDSNPQIPNANFTNNGVLYKEYEDVTNAPDPSLSLHNMNDYTFMGWTTDVVPTVGQSSTPTIASFPYSITSDTEFKAVWKKSAGSIQTYESTTTGDPLDGTSYQLQNWTVDAINYEAFAFKNGSTIQINSSRPNNAIYNLNALTLDSISVTVSNMGSAGAVEIRQGTIADTQIKNLSYGTLKGSMTTVSTETFAFTPAGGDYFSIKTNSGYCQISSITLYYKNNSASSTYYTTLPNEDVETIDTNSSYDGTEVLGDITVSSNIELTVTNNTTINNMYVQPNATVLSNDTKSINVNKLIVYSNNNDVPKIDADINAVAGIVFEKTIDDQGWYFFSLPFDCTVSDIICSKNYGSEWVIKSYNAQGFANGNTGNNWVALNSNDIITAHQGYIVGVGTGSAILTFNPSTWMTAYDKTNNQSINVTTVDGTAGDNKYKNWNIIGTPFFTEVGPSTDKELTGIAGISGDLYVSIPNPADFGQTYIQRKSSEVNLPAFNAYFVQVASSGTVSFTTQAAASKVINTISESHLELELHNTNQKDVTTIYINENSSNAYEIGKDLIKMGHNPSSIQLYSNSTHGKLRCNSLPFSSNNQIPLGIYNPINESITFTLQNALYSAYEHVYLIDNLNGNTTDLLTSNYITTTDQGFSDDRFYISIHSKDQPTELENTTLNFKPIVYSNTDKSCTIITPQSSYSIDVIDAMGRTIVRHKSTTKESTIPIGVKGIYTIRITYTNGQSFTTQTIIK